MPKPGWYRSGTELIREIRETELQEEILSIWYLGQAGIVVKSGHTVTGIDLYLREADYRLFPPPFSPEEAAELFDFVLMTHNHEDHLDEATVRGLVRAGSRALFVAPEPHREILRELGIPAEQIRGAKAYEELTLSEGLPKEGAGLSVLPVPAAHESFEYDGEGNLTCLGYVLRTPAGSLYHSGDTVEWETMTADLAPLSIDIMCLPVNGSDWKRKRADIIGNLNAREAADVADECGTDLVIPMHFDLFASNLENPAVFADYMHRDHPGKRFHIPVPGERILYMK